MEVISGKNIAASKLIPDIVGQCKCDEEDAK
jgi:hypothetical protein